MEKPLILYANEFKLELEALTNRYVNKVPAMFLADSVRDIYNQLEEMSKVQFEKAKSEYESAEKDEQTTE